MISVLTLTYGRKQLLEESIHSFLLQDFDKSEMVIINDEPNVIYRFNHPKVKIINLNQRFENISKKIEWGFKQCSYDYVYRLDDDDLLTLNALTNVEKQINENPGYEIYRSSGYFYFQHNKFISKRSGEVNNGNVYSKDYLNRITFPDKNIGEDFDITFTFNGHTHESIYHPTMIYRLGMSTYHLSDMFNIPIVGQYELTDKLKEKRKFSFFKKKKWVIDLDPKFNDYYYEQIKELWL
jgi:glycosyltransferase involved in cell wall biosynthesis